MRCRHVHISSTDLEFEARVGPDRLVSGFAGKCGGVVGGQEFSVQALARSRPGRAMMPGMREKRMHDYVRHGAVSLAAAFQYHRR